MMMKKMLINRECNIGPIIDIIMHKTQTHTVPMHKHSYPVSLSYVSQTLSFVTLTGYQSQEGGSYLI